MTVLPSTEAGFQPGTWRPWVYGTGRQAGAVVTCPICLRTMSVGGGRFGSAHTIAADGTVSPSLVCPYPPCAWHVFVRLDGWPAAPRPLPRLPRDVRPVGPSLAAVLGVILVLALVVRLLVFAAARLDVGR